MKKVLFATTALVATAGMAAADISLSGSAEMGLKGGDSINDTTGVVTVDTTEFVQDIEVTFSLSGESDDGLSFGASIQLDEAAGPDVDDAGTAVYISGAWGKLTLGDTDGGFDYAMDEVPSGPGSLTDNNTSHSGYNGNAGLDGTAAINPGQVLSYVNTIGAVGFGISVELDDTPGSTQADPIIGVGLKYAMPLAAAPLKIGVGYQTTSTSTNVDTNVMGISLATAIGGLDVGVNFSEQALDGSTADQTHSAIGFGYSEGAMSFGVNYGEYENRGNVLNTDTSGWGFTAGYDLGGGAKVLAGWSSNDVSVNTVETSTTDWSLGISMSF